MRDRIPTQVLDNGAIRYAVYDENGAFLRYEYMLPADEPTDPGTPLSKSTIMTDDVEALIWGAAADRTPNDAFGKISELYQHWWSVLNSAGTTTYVHSPDRNAYPDSGTVGGLTYKYLGKPFDNAKTAPKMELVSYTGTGKYGSSNPTSATFSFAPDVVLYLGALMSDGYYIGLNTEDTATVAIVTNVLSTSFVNGQGLCNQSRSSAYGKKSADGKTISWYHTSGAGAQFNASGYRYYLLGIKY